MDSPDACGYCGFDVTAECERDELRAALLHYAEINWLPDSDERGYVALEALGLIE